MELIPVEERKSFNGKIGNHIQRYLKGNELRLYMLLCQYHNDNYGYAFPTYKQIREYFGDGWDCKRIRGHLVGLEEKGFIKIGKNKKKVGYDNNTYKIFITDFPEEDKHINELNVINYEIDKVNNGIEMYQDSIKRNLNNNEIINYLNFEIKQLEATKKDLLVEQQALLEKLQTTN